MTEPKRLSDPGSASHPALRDLIGAARTDLPDEERLQGLALRLGPLVGAPGIKAPSGAPWSAGAAAATKLGIAVVAVLGGTTVAVVALSRGNPTSVPAAPPAASAPAVSPLTMPASASTPSTPAFEPIPAPPERKPAPHPAAAPSTAAASVSAEPSAETANETEVSLLQRAQQALDRDPATALALANRHAIRFPTGGLAQEREVIAMDALVRLNRRDEARARAGRFFQAYPASAYRPRIDALLGGGLE